MNFFKPFFKKIGNFKYIYISNFKISKFKNKKWAKVLLNLKRQLIKNKFYQFKIIDHNKLLLNLHSNKFNAYNYSYKIYVTCLKNFSAFYINSLPKKLLKLNNKNSKQTLNLLERRIDVVLIRSKLCPTLRTAKKVLINGYIFINEKNIKIKSYILNSGNFIKFKIYLFNYKKYLIDIFKWFIPLNNLIINYGTKELIFFKILNTINFVLFFPHYLHLKNLYLFLEFLRLSNLIFNQYTISSSLIKNYLIKLKPIW